MESREKKKMEFDNLIELIGGGGRYQHLLFILSVYSFALVNFQTYTQMFSQGDDKYRCYVEGCDNNTSIYDEDWLKYTTPKIKDEKTGSKIFSRCQTFEYAKSGNFCEVQDFLNSTKINCDQYIFKNPNKKLNKEWNLVCGGDNYLSISTSVYMAGFLFGAIIFGIIADKFGRRMSFLLSVLMIIIASTALIFVNNFVLYVVCRFFVGAAVISISMTAYVLLNEICGARKRMIVVLSTSGSEIGLFTMAALAYQFRDWRDLQIAVTIITSILLIFVLLLPESIRWLLSKGKIEESKIILNKMAKWNGQKLPETLVEKLNDLSQQNSAKPLGPIDLLTYTEVRRRIFIMAFIWISDSLIGYGLTLGAKNLNGNIYVNFCILAVGCTVGSIIGIVASKYVRRRLTMSLCFLALTIVSVATACLPAENKEGSVILAMFGVLFINTSFNITYIYTAELFPTPIRSTALGTGSMFSRLGSIAAPFVNKSIYFWRPLPSLIFGIFSLISGCIVLMLPETLNIPLPTTMEDVEKNKAAEQENKYKLIIT